MDSRVWSLVGRVLRPDGVAMFLPRRRPETIRIIYGVQMAYLRVYRLILLMRVCHLVFLKRVCLLLVSRLVYLLVLHRACHRTSQMTCLTLAYAQIFRVPLAWV